MHRQAARARSASAHGESARAEADGRGASEPAAARKKVALEDYPSALPAWVERWNADLAGSPGTLRIEVAEIRVLCGWSQERHNDGKARTASGQRCASATAAAMAGHTQILYANPRVKRHFFTALSSYSALSAGSARSAESWSSFLKTCQVNRLNSCWNT